MTEKKLTIQLNGEKFIVSLPRDHDYFEQNWLAWQDGETEALLFDFVSSFENKDFVFFDIGAWIGAVTLLASRNAKSVFSFEADPVSIVDLKRNIELNSINNVTVVPKFVSNQTGMEKLFSIHSGNNSGSSMFHTDGKSSWEVETVKLDEFINSEVDASAELVLKMDIEGAEYQVLPTISAMIRSKRIKKLCLSLHPHLLAKKYTGNRVVTKVIRRANLIFQTIKVIMVVRSFDNVSNANGNKLNLTDLLWDAVATGGQRDANRELYFYMN